jgi:hypothetical protein
VPLTYPYLNGQALPLPASNVRELVPVVEEKTLADGTTVRYHRGHKTRVTLRWTRKREDVAKAIDALGRLRGSTQFVDQDGTPYVVLVESSDGLDAVPGTDPPRYGCGLVLIERRPR